MKAVCRSARDRVEKIMRGQRPAGLATAPLYIAQSMYRLGVSARNFLYDKNIFKTRRAPCKIISVGALTVGGAGKTPFTELVVKKLAHRRPGILSRGYGADCAQKVMVVSDGRSLGPAPPVSADEPYMLARKLDGVPVVCAPDRMAGAKVMAERFGVNIIVLDDGFQRRDIKRDLNILLVDGENPFGSGRLVPAGILREPAGQACRCDMAVVVGGDEGQAQRTTKLIERHISRDTPVIYSAGAVAGFTDRAGAATQPPNGPVYCFCAIANPDYFRTAVKNSGLEIAGFRSFPDHHKFSMDELETINDEAIASGAVAIVTTEKDTARLAGVLYKFDTALKAVKWEMEITSGEDRLDEALESVFENGAQSGKDIRH